MKLRFKRSPEEILKEIGIFTPEDIDLELIAYSLGAEVRFDPLDDCEGNIIGTHDRAIITINSKSKPERKRFSLGHEIGHWVNDRGQNLTYKCTDTDLKERIPKESDFRQHKEIRANKFSSELLQPAFIVKNLIKNMPVTVSTAEFLANSFHVSVTTSLIRLSELSEAPHMLCCWSTNGDRLRFSRSGNIPDFIWPIQKVIKSSQLQSFDGEVDGDKWLEFAGAEDHTIWESTFFNGFQWYTLLWWQNEKLLL